MTHEQSAEGEGEAENLGFFPLDEIRTVVGFFRGDTSITWQAAVLAALEVIRFGVDNVSTQPQALQTGPCSEEQAIAYLEGLTNQPEGTQPQLAAAGGMWAALLPVIAQLLAGWLAKRSGAGV